MARLVQFSLQYLCKDLVVYVKQSDWRQLDNVVKLFSPFGIKEITPRLCDIDIVPRHLLRVEDTADVQQKKTKGQKNEENNKGNRFVERRSFVKCTVSSTRRRSQEFDKPA